MSKCNSTLPPRVGYMIKGQRVRQGGIKGGIWVELREVPPIFHQQFHLTQTTDIQYNNHSAVEGWNYIPTFLFFGKNPSEICEFM